MAQTMPDILSVLTLFILSVDGFILPQSILDQPTASNSVDWSSIPPSDDLTWTPCLSNFQCARLSVPLDYSVPDGPKAAIALQLLSAANTSASRGTIFLNPGGPGGAGTAYLTSDYERIRNLTGSDYALLGFDPRGVGASTPSAICFDSDLEYYAYEQTLGDGIVLNATDGSVPLVRSSLQAVGELCAKVIGGSGTQDLNATAEEWGIGRFMDTATVARDMLSIVTVLGEEQLMYYGVSYGTMLGEYFATLFPDKVGRMILDGVLDGEEQQMLDQTDYVVDADTVFESFFTFCHSAGPDQCSFYAPSPEAIRGRYDHIVASLIAHPVSLPFTPGGPTILTAAFIRTLVAQATYYPLTSFPALAEVLSALESGNTTIWQTVETGSQAIVQECQSGGSTPFWERQSQAQSGVMCSDAAPLNDTDEQFAAYLDKAVATSAVRGSFLGEIRLSCDGWSIQAKSRYIGPVASDNTSSPILFLSNKYDPICPLEMAQRVQSRFKGSALLVQNSYGHTATLSNVSPCTYSYVREYLVNGTLPEAGTVCQPEVEPFGTVVITTA